MDKAGLLDLYAFSQFTWGLIREAAPDDNDLVRVAPGSGWPDLRHCLAHMVLAYDRWVPAIVDLEARPLREVVDGDFRTWAQIDTQRLRVQKPLKHWLETWSDAELTEQHDVNVDGDILRYSRGELALHLLLHERGHNGDVTTLFWQLGIEPETWPEYRFHLGRE